MRQEARVARWPMTGPGPIGLWTMTVSPVGRDLHMVQQRPRGGAVMGRRGDDRGWSGPWFEPLARPVLPGRGGTGKACRGRLCKVKRAGRSGRARPGAVAIEIQRVGCHSTSVPSMLRRSTVSGRPESMRRSAVAWRPTASSVALAATRRKDRSPSRGRSL